MSWRLTAGKIGTRAILLATAVVALASCGPREPMSEGAQPEMRRLTEEQYRNVVADVFGSTITFGGRFDPLLRTDGLVALGARTARITPTGFEQYYVLARSIAAQVVDEENRQTLIPCQPASPRDADDVCAKQFFTQVGRLLYRRPRETTSELNISVSAAHEVAASAGNFYEGLAYAMAGMMVTPKFLFITDTTEPDPAHAGAQRLTAYARASRLSFLLWNSVPDDMLLTAAEHGDLDSKSGLTRQVDRMLTSTKVSGGVRAFFTDFLDLQKFETLEKDPIIYPAFNIRAGEDAKEQLLRTVADHLVTRDLDYRDLFTTRQTFLTATLARIYKVPAGRPDGGWTPFEFAKNDPHAGITTEVGFLALNSHPGRSSPTIRGRAIRETLLCQKVPDPQEGTVDFSLFNDPNSPHKTARERLTAHRTAEACAGCHKITDPIGLGLENFDGAGATRVSENGERIDASGELDGIPFQDAAGLSKALHDDPATTSCLVNRLYAYALGRPPERNERDVVAYFQAGFVKDGYRVPQLLKRIALSDAFYRIGAAKSGTATQTSATDDAGLKENPS